MLLNSSCIIISLSFCRQDIIFIIVFAICYFAIGIACIVNTGHWREPPEACDASGVNCDVGALTATRYLQSSGRSSADIMENCLINMICTSSNFVFTHDSYQEYNCVLIYYYAGLQHHPNCSFFIPYHLDQICRCEE